ncbi:HAD family hydrolase [Cognaticolwellia beringensis]|uniref:Phosphoglycolate phosphatase n=1 Tax=Cognaticolwellia beringensis TaxID=1967665 RepID=A0A222GBN0_9GAMM|nr:HAD-IA family hydrolase [Cognaticolwellia beringensis]ASP49289.1 phosphoglycolate phosphatase [Cognaticolwellia beringensis]
MSTENQTTKPIASVLFDLDGTLLDTADDLGAALNHVLQRYNKPVVAAKDYRPVASDGALGLLNLGFGHDIKNYDYEVLRQQFLDYYQENIAVHTRLYSGVTELLQHLEANGIPWGIITNKPEGLTKILLPHYPEFINCAVMVGGDTLTKRKPDPEPILHACELINVNNQHCYYVGDALRDIQAGNSALMKTFVANWGYILADEDCLTWQADHIIDTPTDLLAFIK